MTVAIIRKDDQGEPRFDLLFHGVSKKEISCLLGALNSWGSISAKELFQALQEAVVGSDLKEKE